MGLGATRPVATQELRAVFFMNEYLIKYKYRCEDSHPHGGLAIIEEETAIKAWEQVEKDSHLLKSVRLVDIKKL